MGPNGWWFRREIHPGLQCDFAVSYPPQAFIDYGLEYVTLDPRWEFGPVIPEPADFAWLQLAIHHLLPGGTAAVVLPTYVLSKNDLELADAEIIRVRRNLISEGVVRCIIALPTDSGTGSNIPTALWICKRRTPRDYPSDVDPHAQEVLLIDLSSSNSLADGDAGLADARWRRRIADFYRQWDSDRPLPEDSELAQLSASVSIERILDSGGDLRPSRWQ